MTFNPEDFNVLMGLAQWGIVFGILVVVALLVSLAVSVVTNRRGGVRAFGRQSRRLAGELFSTSFRRVWGVAMLTFREATRRKALLVFIVFAVLFMFAGWFLSQTNRRAEMQVKVYVSTMLSAITYMTIAVMLLLSCWGIPEDIKNRSLHTVVTKPVRRNEVYLGRILGFSMIGSLILAFMGLIGYFWIVRQIPAQAHSELIARVPVYGKLSFLDQSGEPRERGINVGDIWDFRSFVTGGTRARAIWTFDNLDAGRVGDTLRLESRFEVFRTHKGDQKRGVRCQLQFVNDLRNQTATALASAPELEALNQNLENGDFKQAADTMYGVADGLQNDTLKLAPASMTRIDEGYGKFAELMRPFLQLEERSGDREWIQTVVRQAELCSTAAKDGKAAELATPLKALADQFAERADVLAEILVDKVYRHEPFSVQEFKDNFQTVVKTADVAFRVDGREQRGDLFKEIVHGGRLNVHVQCLDAGQYIGMARPDLFVRLPDRHFAVGYAKAVFGVWLMMLLVVILGVTTSCFLKGPVSTLLTLMFLVLGSAFHSFLTRLTEGEIESAGMVESMYRIGKHMNPTSEIGEGFGFRVMRIIDEGMITGLKGVVKIVPNFDNYRVIPYIANGFDVPWNSALLPALLTTLGFFIPCMLLGYLCLASRELEDK